MGSETLSSACYILFGKYSKPSYFTSNGYKNTVILSAYNKGITYIIKDLQQKSTKMGGIANYVGNISVLDKPPIASRPLPTTSWENVLPLNKGMHRGYKKL